MVCLLLVGYFTAVSPDAEAMKSFITRLRKDFDLLSAEMSDVIRIRDDVGRRGQPQMDINWLNNVRAREGEVVELPKKINEIRRGGGTNLNACHELNKEVIVCLKAVVRLKQEANHNVVAHRVAHSPILEGSVLHNGDSSSRSVKAVLKHLAKNGPISFSPSVASRTFADENKYMLNSSITRGGSTCFKLPVPSEVSPAFAEHMPVELPRVDFEMKNQENKDIKPEVKKDEVTTVVLRVSMHCEDCAQKIKKNLVKMEGVLTADADQGNSLVTVKCDIDPNKLVDCIWKKTKKRAVIVKTEPEKKQEEKVVEPGKKKEELDTVETKSERKGAAEIKDEVIRITINQEKEEKEKPKAKVELKREDMKKIEEKHGIEETELRREGQERIKEEERRIKLKKKKEENLGTVETRSEGKGAVEIKFKKKVEEIGIANTEQEKEEKAKAEFKRVQEGSREEIRRKSEKRREEELGRVKSKPEGQYASAEIKLQKKEEEKSARETELKKKGQKRIKERRLSAKINPEKEEEEKGKGNLFDNKTEESRGVEMKMRTEENLEETKRVEEGLTYWRTEMQNAYYSQILSDENSNSCIIL
ncbi:hypothetical protein FRX31_003338 [Thalictrum thalictroides]|uniref:HMA domain-containing protein n=1 Tax=Thalictrum thalictroides TaxID=46969 RepID=A0A7J6XDY4_THATH|nr:hypothetical protein FRX31_003338 [Thalictrum thalictroides]